MQKTNNVPKLRFPGFEDEWESCKISDITTVSSFKQYIKHATNDGKFEVIQQGNVPVSGYADGNPFMEYEKVTLFGDHTLSLYKPEKPFFVASDGLKILYSNFMNGDFYYYLLEKNKPESEGYKRHFSILKECECSYPKLTCEQQQIGTFLKSIDHLITLPQQKLESLKEYKKAMLQKMFPKAGEKVPEIRFPGFEDEWEEKKLCEIAEFNPKSNLPDVFEYVDLESVIGTEMISHRTETKMSAPSRAQRLAQTGDVFFQTVRPYQRNNYLFSKDDKNYVFSTGYAQMRPNIDAKFLMSFLQTDEFVKNVLDNCTGTSYPAINTNDLSNLNILLPILKEEQENIGKSIANIDTLINLNQQKLDLMKEYKKGLLQQMFV